MEQIRCTTGLRSIGVFERMTEDETLYIRVELTAHYCGRPAYRPGLMGRYSENAELRFSFDLIVSISQEKLHSRNLGGVFQCRSVA